MSRCFPFPPPGYEKKVALESPNLIIKEKHKQKKDRERKERSDGKEKVRSEKHRDGKDRKEKKHKEKKHKKRDKHKSSEEKKNEGSSEIRNGDCKPDKEIDDSRILVELEKRLRNADGVVDSCMVHKIAPTDLRKPKVLEKLENLNDHNVDRSYEENGEKRDVCRIANTQCVKVDARDLENGFIANQNKYEDVARKVDGFPRKKEENEKIKQRSSEIRSDEHRHERREGQKAADKKRKKEGVESIKEPIKQFWNNRESVDFHEPSNGSMKKVGCQGSLPNRTSPESNGFLHVNGVRPNNTPRAVSHSHHSRDSQNGSGSHPRQNITNIAARKALPSSNHMVNGKPVGKNSNAIDHGRDTTKGFGPSHHLGIGKKTEPCQMPKAEPRHISSYGTSDNGRAATNSHMVSNGSVPSQNLDMEKKTEEPCPSPKVEQKVVYNHKVDGNDFQSTENERKVSDPNFDKALAWGGQGSKTMIDEKDSRKNGIIDDAKQHASSKPSFSPSPSLKVKDKEKSEKSSKSKSHKSMKPHPDLKYLDQVLTVPRVDWPISDDQEWLLGSLEESKAKRPKLAAFSVTVPTKEVWSEAMRLEPADVIALPYVVPY